MNSPSPELIDRAREELEKLITGLELSTDERDKIQPEWLNHLLESCERLQQQGWQVDEAINESLRRFGGPTELATPLRQLSWRRDLKSALFQTPGTIWFWLGLEVIAMPLWCSLLWPQWTIPMSGWLVSMAGIGIIGVALVWLLRLTYTRLRRLGSTARGWVVIIPTVFGCCALIMSIRFSLPADLAATFVAAAWSVSLLKSLVVGSILTFVTMWLASRPVNNDTV